ESAAPYDRQPQLTSAPPTRAPRPRSVPSRSSHGGPGHVKARSSWIDAFSALEIARSAGHRLRATRRHPGPSGVHLGNLDQVNMNDKHVAHCNLHLVIAGAAPSTKRGGGYDQCEWVEEIAEAIEELATLEREIADRIFTRA